MEHTFVPVQHKNITRQLQPCYLTPLQGLDTEKHIKGSDKDKQF